MNENKGHRQRLRARFKVSGTSFQDHELLELFLFQSLPRKDTNKIAHNLLNRFGSLSEVFDAPAEQLVAVEGISEITAQNIALVKEVWRRYKESSLEKVNLGGMKSIVRYAQTLINDNRSERMIAVFVDNGTNYISKREYTSENDQFVKVDTKQVVSDAIYAKASGIILFHCHVKGSCLPSPADKALTEKLYVALAGINVVLLDHMIFNDINEYFSFHANNYFEVFAEKYGAAESGKKPAEILKTPIVFKNNAEY